MRKSLLRVMSIVSLASIAACAMIPVPSSGGLRNFDSEPVVGWWHVLPSDSSEDPEGLVGLFGWPARSAVLAVSSVYDDYLLELLDTKTGEVLESEYLSTLTPVELRSRSFHFQGAETKEGDLLLALSGSYSQLLVIGQDGFNLTSPFPMLSIGDPSYRDVQFRITFDPIYSDLWDEDLVFSYARDPDSLVVLRDDLTEVWEVAYPDPDDGYVHDYRTGMVRAVYSSESLSFEYFDFSNLNSGPNLITLPISQSGAVPNFASELGSGYLFLGSSSSGTTNLFTVSSEGEVIDIASLAPSGGGRESVSVIGEKIFVTQEIREQVSVKIFDASLSTVAEIPLPGVERVYLNDWVHRSESLGKLILETDNSFALLDISSQEVTGFRPLSGSDALFNAGFSNDAFLIWDSEALVSYDFQLGLNWSFSLLEGERILRVGEDLYLVSENRSELLQLTSD